MKKIHETDALNDAIVALDHQQTQELRSLKEQFHVTYESLKPVNLILNTLKEAAGSSNLKGNLVNTSIGLATGYLSRFFFGNVSKSPVKKLLGTAVLYGVTNVVTKHPGIIKSLGRGLFKLIRGKSKSAKYKAENYEI
ncbi:MAG: hypothetical protein M3Q56_09270 [Bacteroidota bacterium]|nr:hypothetical protein [Bacteroidota bacterium]